MLDMSTFRLVWDLPNCSPSRVHLIHACNEEQKNGKFSSREKEEKKEKPKDKGGEARKSQDNERENHKVYH